MCTDAELASCNVTVGSPASLLESVDKVEHRLDIKAPGLRRSRCNSFGCVLIGCLPVLPSLNALQEMEK